MLQRLYYLIHNTVTLLTVLLFLLQPSCSENLDIPEEEKTPIDFDAWSATTKAFADDDNIKNKSFKVLGKYSDGTTFNTSSNTTVFENTEVTYVNGGWSYVTNTEPSRSWEPGKTYRFRAIWPSIDGINLDNDFLPNLYNVPQEISQQEDFLISDIIDRDSSSDTSPVRIQFKHALCRVNLKVTNMSDDGDTYKVTKVIISGIKAGGFFKDMDSTWDTSTTTSTLTFTKTLEANLNNKNDNQQYFVDLMLIPQNVSNISVSVEYIVTHNGNNTNKNKPVRIYTSTVPSWKPSQIYSYNIGLSETYGIIFGTPTVEPWGDPKVVGTIVYQ